MARRRRRRNRQNRAILIGLAPVLAVACWWLYSLDNAADPIELALETATVLTSDRPEVPPSKPAQTDVTEKGEPGESATPAQPTVAAPDKFAALLAAGKKALASGDLITARTHFSDALVLSNGQPDVQQLRAELTRIGTQTIFSPRIFEHDPLVDRYVIKAGDTLAKIAAANKVTADLLADINGIPNKNLIRGGQTIKVVHGPFRAVVDRKTFTLDVYLGTTFVRQYRVGLGLDGSTPSGDWEVATKLVNPTYYPPRGGKIIAADDPENPLGERWIGLNGVGGEAQGQVRYGIHGTVEPDSIGKNASLGCVRMYNEDVAALYTYLVPEHSTVTIH